MSELRRRAVAAGGGEAALEDAVDADSPVSSRPNLDNFDLGHHLPPWAFQCSMLSATRVLFAAEGCAC